MPIHPRQEMSFSKGHLDEINTERSLTPGIDPRHGNDKRAFGQNQHQEAAYTIDTSWTSTHDVISVILVIGPIKPPLCSNINSQGHWI